MADCTIRAASVDDAAALLAIYAPYVKETAITFEYDVPSVDEFRQRIEKTLTMFPYLVLEKDGTILGYAYAGKFQERMAYAWDVEMSIYLAQDARGEGYGKWLYEAMERALKQQGFLNLNACIAYPVQEDEYLTRASVHFHTRMGYRKAGRFHRCGYKFDRWYDMVWMEKSIGRHGKNMTPPVAFPDVREDLGF